MSLFVDKHRPKELSKLDYHPELSSRLQALVRPLLHPLRTLISSRAYLLLTRSGDHAHRHMATFPTLSFTVRLARARRRASWPL